MVRKRIKTVLQPLEDSEHGVLIANLLNGFHRAGKLEPEALPLLQAYLHARYDAMQEHYERTGPDLNEGPALVEELYRNGSLAEMSFFERRGKDTTLYDTRDGTVLVQASASGKDFSDFLDQGPVQVEILLEVLIGVIGALFFSGAAHNENLKKAAKETATQLVNNPAVRRVLKALMELLTTRVSTYNMRVRLRELLKELFELISDGLSDMLKKIFAGMSWWDIAVILFDLLVCFTPVGWAKRAVSLMSPFVGLTVSLGVKYHKFQEGST